MRLGIYMFHYSCFPCRETCLLCTRVEYSKPLSVLCSTISPVKGYVINGCVIVNMFCVPLVESKHIFIILIVRLGFSHFTKLFYRKKDSMSSGWGTDQCEES